MPPLLCCMRGRVGAGEEGGGGCFYCVGVWIWIMFEGGEVGAGWGGRRGGGRGGEVRGWGRGCHCKSLIKMMMRN